MPPDVVLVPKLRQNSTSVGASPTPHWGSSQRSTDPLAAYKGGKRGCQGSGKEGKGGKEGMRREPFHFKIP